MPPQVSLEAYISNMKRLFKKKMVSKGYSPELVDMALKLADKWIHELAMYFSNGVPWIYTSIVRQKYKDALQVAERWLQEVSK